MVNQKNILIIAISLLFINYIQAKPNYKKSSKKLHFTTNDNSSRGILKIENNNNKNILLNRNQNNYYLNSFDDGLDNWIINDGWNRSDLDFYSEEYSINSFDMLKWRFSTLANYVSYFYFTYRHNKRDPSLFFLA